MNKEEIAKQIEETEIKLKQLREALSEPEYKAGDVWTGKGRLTALVTGLGGYVLLDDDAITLADTSLPDVLPDYKTRLGTFNEVFIRRDLVEKDYVFKADVLSLTDFNDDSLARCINQGLNFEACPILHKQLLDLIA